MGTENFIPEIWSGLIQSNLHDALVYGAVCNNNYSGDVVDGDRVRINMISAIDPAAYTPNSTTLTYSQLDGAAIFLDINRRYSANFCLEDSDKKQARGDVEGEGARELGFAIANEIDEYLASLYTEAQGVYLLGTEGSAIDITSLNVVEYLTILATRLDEANVPQDMRWAVIPPWFKQKITLADITLNTNNTDVFRNGFVGRALGFNFYVSNNVSEGTPATHQLARIMAGYPGTMTLAQQISTVEKLRDPTRFRDNYRALSVYGAKVIRPNTLACLRCDYTAEP